MIDHVGINVSNFEKSKAFYVKALAALGYQLLKEFNASATDSTATAGFFGVEGKPEFWVGQGDVNTPRLHIAFRAETHEIVQAFYKAALEAGGQDNGAPGLRAYYHPNYYGAFVLDLDGHNIEAVCHGPV
ncbi:VOC family protein [Pseudanabaena sp. FACHB-2040]|uniref:VOC family protein n=1 Tax=Pseudanabaena sp. FACHB-2040 TaxID=2692859 RepID=UPI001687887A|nr:VOC family protein [Pseudanabaena sp. FACHB-2040]MBD2259353.1 VOC family protein [Pseudanabaena sp. FACHB-2040]